MRDMFGPEYVFTKEEYENYYNERFIYKDELSNIVKIMQTSNNYKILILGALGSGKTTLLHLISYYMNKKAEIISGHAFGGDNYGFLMKKDSPLLLDGLDEIQNPYGLLSFLNENKCDKLVCTSRPNFAFGEYFTHIINLNPLTQYQIELLINKLGLDIRQLHPLLASYYLMDRPITPRDILKLAIANISDSNTQDFYFKYSNFLYQYGSGIDFSSDIIQPTRILIAPSKEIIKSVTVFNDSLLRRAICDPKIMYSFSSREFEKMICELLEKQGYKVKLTKQTRDGGKDIIIVQNSILGEFCIYVECKKYDMARPISVGLVRELYGTVMAENATAGMMITTSYFTKDAKAYTEKIKHRMTLKDYNDLVQELNRISG